ncbi:MAG: hypothetical protein GKR94_28335 [Gammaproteobacteria bacterium]|nr:hypothetical protein [Gammaproteobacteria bacterium]
MSRRVVLVGTPGPLADGVMAALVQNNAALVGVAAIGTPPATPCAGGLAVVQGDRLSAAAARAGIPVEWSASALEAPLLAAIHRFKPSLAVVACLATRLSPAALASTAEGFWNVHPSALPKHRGPAPMFWQLRDGDEWGGVSIHRMDARFDTGPVASSAPVLLPAGIAEPAAQYAAGLKGGALVASLLRASEVRWQEQAAAQATYESHPAGAAAYTFGEDWPVLRAWRFLRGVRWRGQPFRFVSGGQCWVVREAVDVAPGRRLPCVRQVSERVLDLPLADGVLRVRR